MKPIVAYARDPGSANMTIAALSAIRERPRGAVGARLADLFGIRGDAPIEAEIFASGPAAKAWSSAGREARDPTQAVEAVRFALGLLTGLDDVDDPVPRGLWRAARIAGVPSVAFCDNDVNLAVRLRDSQGHVAPDFLFALSDAGRAEIAAAGVPAERVVIAENLHLAAMARRRFELASRRARMRAHWGVDPGREVWLYAGVVRRELSHLRRTDPEDEVEVLRRLIARLAREPENPYLVVRPHPRDPDGKYSAAFRPSDRARETREGDSYDAIAGADVIVSLSAAVLDEARLLGRRIVDPAHLP